MCLGDNEPISNQEVRLVIYLIRKHCGFNLLSPSCLNDNQKAIFRNKA